MSSFIPESLANLISNIPHAMSTVTPLEVFGGLILVCLIVHLFSRSKDALVIALSAALYALPFVIPMVTKLVR